MHHLKNSFVEGTRKISSSDCNAIKLLTKSVRETIEFLAEVKSVSITKTSDIQTDSSTGMYKSHLQDSSFFGCKATSVSDIKSLLLQCIDILKNSRQIQRVRATESITCMLSTTDRFATNERGYGIQIGYVLPGSSFPERDARAVLDKLYLKTVQGSGHVPAIAFDGQFHQLLAISNLGKLNYFSVTKAVLGNCSEYA